MTEHEPRGAIDYKFSHAREVIIVGVAILLVVASLWGFYSKSTEVSKLRPLLDNIETQMTSQTSEIDELKTLLTELEEKMAQEQEQYNAFAAVLRQEIDSLTKRQAAAANTNNRLTGKIAYLTFDDGPLAATAQILDILKAHDVKATFFVNGRDNNYSLSMYRRMVAEGHTIGNHTYSHEYDKVYGSVSGFVAEVEQLQELIKKTTGVVPEVLRFPGGSDNRISVTYSGKDLMPTLVRVVQAMGLQYFDWNVSSASASAAATKDSIYNHVIAGCQDRAVANILFHETVAVAGALPEIIEELKRQGYTFAPLTKSSPSMQFLR